MLLLDSHFVSIVNLPCCVLYLQWWWNGGYLEELSEEDWAQLEEAASCAQVVKVKMDVKSILASDSDHTRAASRALAAGFSKNPLLNEVELGMVPKELVETLRGILCTNTALTVKVSDKSTSFL